MKKKIIGMLTFIVIVGLTLAGCATEKKTLTMVWYPNESGVEFEGARAAISDEIEKLTGKKVEHTLTTDYNITIEAIASGKADLAFMGATGYIQANKKNPKVLPLVIPSGKSGGESDAVYYSWLTVPSEKKADYQTGGKYAIDNIKGKNFSFVSNSSTSGFKVPSDNIVKYFNLKSSDELLEPDKFFKKVLFGGSHQGSAMNMLNGDADVAAVCDTCLESYVGVSSGEKNAVGSEYTVNSNAVEPFDKVQGKKFTIIESTPVLNAPFVINTDTVSDADRAKILEVFLSDTIMNNKQIWKDKDDKETKAFHTKESDKQRYIEVSDSWFDPLRK